MHPFQDSRSNPPSAPSLAAEARALSWAERLPISWPGLIGWMVGGLLGTLIEVGHMAAHPGTCTPSLASAPLGSALVFAVILSFVLPFLAAAISHRLLNDSPGWPLWILLGTLGPLLANKALHVDALLNAHIPHGLHETFYIALCTLLIALGGTASQVAPDRTEEDPWFALLHPLVALGETARQIPSLLLRMRPATPKTSSKNDNPRDAHVNDPPSFLNIRVHDDDEDNKEKDRLVDANNLPAPVAIARLPRNVERSPFNGRKSCLGTAGTIMCGTMLTWGLMNILPLIIVLLAVQPTPETTKVWTDAGRNLPAEYDEVVLQVQLWAGVIAVGLGLTPLALSHPARRFAKSGHTTANPRRVRSVRQKGRRPSRPKKGRP